MFRPFHLLPVAGLCVGLAGTGSGLADSNRYAPEFHLTGAVKNPQTYTAETLKQLPATKVDVFYSTGEGPVSASYTGVLLWDLLNTAGVATDPAVKNDILHKQVTATASDGYHVVFSLGELDPHFGGEQVIVAYLQDGQPLDAKSGAARIIAPGDKAGGRNVQALVELNVGGAK